MKSSKLLQCYWMKHLQWTQCCIEGNPITVLHWTQCCLESSKWLQCYWMEHQWTQNSVWNHPTEFNAIIEWIQWTQCCMESSNWIQCYYWMEHQWTQCCIEWNVITGLDAIKLRINKLKAVLNGISLLSLMLLNGTSVNSM